MEQENLTVPEDSGQKKKAGFAQLLLLQLAVIIFSVASALSKAASAYPVLSWNWIVFYGGNMVLLAVYAVAWQQFLKSIPLTTAYSNRAMSMLWSMIIGVIFFHETVKWTMVLGVLIIAVGIYVVVKADEH